MEDYFRIRPVGVIHKGRDASTIEIFEPFGQAMLGLEGFSHIQVFYWFHQNDRPEKRNILQVHPKNKAENPLTGVFATLSPTRPNLIGMSICRLRSINGLRISIDLIDALDGSPVVDIKCFVPSRVQSSDVTMPAWAKP